MAEKEQQGKRIPFGFGKRVEKSAQFKNGWQEMSPFDVPKAQPVIICLGGNGTTSDRFANGFAKTAEEMLHIRSGAYIDIYSLRYGYDDDSEEDTMHGDITMQEVEDLTNALLVNRVTDENGKRLPLREACKNMRNLNFVTHCFGQRALNPMLSELANKMEYNLGYSEDEIRMICHQIMNVSYAPYAIPSKLCTNVAFVSKNDETVIFKFRELFGEKLGNPLGSADNPELIVDENTLYVYADTFVGYKEYVYERLRENLIDEHSPGRTIGRDENWGLNNKFSDVISRCFANSLALGVVNSRQNVQQERLTPLPRVEMIKDMLKSEVQYSNSMKKQNEQYAEYLKSGIPVEQLLEDKNITEKDVVNRKITLKELTKGVSAKVKYPEPFNFSIGWFNCKNRVQKEVLNAEELMKEECVPRKYMMLLNNNMEVYSYGQDAAPQDIKKAFAISQYLQFQDLEDSIFCMMDRENDKNILSIQKGLKFPQKEYQNLQDLVQSAQPSSENLIELKDTTTRIILNKMIAGKIPLDGLRVDKDIALNQDVLQNEIAISNEGLIAPAIEGVSQEKE